MAQSFSYTTPCKYFITFCTKFRVLSELVEIAHDCWQDIPNHHRNIRLDAFIVMPDHTHEIIELLPIDPPSKTP